MPTRAWRSFLEGGQIGTDVMVMQTPRRLVLLVLLLVWWSASSLHVSLVMARSRSSKSGLDIWIDDKQVKTMAGVDMNIPIIHEGKVNPYISMDFSDQLVIPPDMDTVNLTWKAGYNEYTYEFDKFQSLNQDLLYQPLLGIPERGTIPRYPQVFQITIPCKGTKGGVASLLLRLKIFDQRRHQLKDTPIQFRLKKKCNIFATTSRCKYDCRNGGTCNHRGTCDCPAGFKGNSCETALCNPQCQNNGTCVSPSRCRCLPGYQGAYCEKAACGRPCQNGGHCLPEGFCWCAKGFFGDACEYSRCNPHCRNGGTCIGPNHCQCTDDFTGPLCEHSLAPIRVVRIVGPSSEASSTNSSTSPSRKSATKPSPRKPRTIKNLEMKIRKAERRLLKIALRKSRKWGLSTSERRTLRKLKRSTDEKALSLKERRYVIKTMTRERKHLTSKDKTKLKRFKHLIRQAKNKQKKPRKRRIPIRRKMASSTQYYGKSET